MSCVDLSSQSCLPFTSKRFKSLSHLSLLSGLFEYLILHKRLEILHFYCPDLRMTKEPNLEWDWDFCHRCSVPLVGPSSSPQQPWQRRRQWRQSPDWPQAWLGPWNSRRYFWWGVLSLCHCQAWRAKLSYHLFLGVVGCLIYYVNVRKARNWNMLHSCF